jgi:uncharacterized membrane protein/cytochrome c5
MIPYRWVELHGALTHFPIALILTATLFEAGAFFFKRTEWRTVSYWLVIVGAISSVPSLASGWFAGADMYGSMAKPPPLFVNHRLTGIVSTILTVLFALWLVMRREITKEAGHRATLPALALISGVTGFTGFLGGLMVFGSEPIVEPENVAKSPPAPLTQPLDARLVAKGKQLYTANGCQACHRINGEGATTAPDLTLAGRMNSDLAWQKEHLKNPQKSRPNSTMPAYEHLPDADLEALATYMISLR